MTTNRTLRRLPLLLVAAAAFLALPGQAVAQNDPNQDPGALKVPPPPAPVIEGEETITFTSPKDGFSLLDLLEAVNHETERSVIYDSTTKQQIEKQKVQFVGTYEIPRSRLFDWLQGVLSFSNFILIPIGPSGHEQWMVVQITNQAIRSRPRYVQEDELDLWKDRDGVYIVSTLRVENLNAQDSQRARTAIQQLATTTASIGRINEIPGQNAFVIADFAPVVYAAKRLLEAMDVPIKGNQQTLKRVPINYALASTMEGMLNDLLSGTTTPGQPRPNRNQPQNQVKPEPQIIADDRTNSLVLYAIEEDIKEIESLIEQLDTPYRGKSKIHFRTLKYKEAEDVADLLQELISGTASSTRSTSNNRNNRTNNRTPRNTGTNAASPFGVAGEDDPVIIPDEKSNSLIIHATQDQFSDLGELIDRIDTAQKQVLIETALVELTSDNRREIGVEGYSVEKNVAVDTDGDGVVDTFTDEQSFFGISSFGIQSVVPANVNGIDIPIGTTPNIVQGGITAGIFKNGRIPIIIRALESQTPTRILTMPSVVTSDNQPATITSERTSPFLITTFVGPNQTPQQTFDSVSAETTLTISPSISADDFLRLNINQIVTSFGSAPAGARPPTLSRSIETELMVPNAATVVLGGIVETKESESASGIPLLMDLPVLGYLFRSTVSSVEKTNLFLFVTPRILHDLENFTDFHALTWEKKLLQDKLFGEEVDILNSRFLGPNAPGTADEAMRRIENSGMLEGYRYQEQPTDAERVEAARRRWEEMKDDDDTGGDADGKK